MEGFTWTLAVCALLVIGSTADEDCKDDYLSCVISKDKNSLYCNHDWIRLGLHCAKSCGRCTASEQTPTVCEDQFTECALYKSLGEMDCGRSAVKAACRKTCNACDLSVPNRRELEAVEPYRPVCRDFAGRWCSQNKENNRLNCGVSFIKRRCEKSCGVCEDTGETLCEDQKYYCPMTAFSDMCDDASIQQQCPKSCDICGSGFADKIRKLCRDYSHECDRPGDFCFSRLNAKKLCPKTCGFCNFVYDE
ncbi:unnamed protein product [Owenia fusiformis]|uniref:ShKT domain-containing protein n=1 Tax=Owenia fusiformis TaxID=6347 RepID=A0A8S4PWV6_OWEFU|nr:unnamed protein product [Owenia fusiformis]